MSKAVDIIDGVLFVHTRHYDDVNRVIICHQKKPFRVFSDDAKKELGRLHGEWIITGGYRPSYKCSICGYSYSSNFIYSANFIEHKFCPNCGADMRKEGEVE